MSDTKFIISNASVVDGKLTCYPVMVTDTFQKAVEYAQNNIAEDFGYDSWEEYLGEMDPEITEPTNPGFKGYMIRDNNCDHEECYLIECI